MNRLTLLVMLVISSSLVGCHIEPPLPPPPPATKVVCSKQPICVPDAQGQILCQPRCRRD